MTNSKAPCILRLKVWVERSVLPVLSDLVKKGVSSKSVKPKLPSRPNFASPLPKSLVRAALRVRLLKPLLDLCPRLRLVWAAPFLAQNSALLWVLPVLLRAV